MFFKENFLFYLPKTDKYIIIKAKDISTAVYKLCREYRSKEECLENYKIITGYKTIK